MTERTPNRSVVASRGRAGTLTEPGVASGGGSRRPREAKATPVVCGLYVISTSETVSTFSTALDSASTQCPEKRGHVIFDYNSRLGGFFYNFYRWKQE